MPDSHPQIRCFTTWYTRNITCTHVILCVFTADHCVYHMILRVLGVYFQKHTIHSVKKNVWEEFTPCIESIFWKYTVNFRLCFFCVKELFFMCNTQCNFHRVYTLLVKKHTPRIQHKYTVQLTPCIHSATYTIFTMLLIKNIFKMLVSKTAFFHSFKGRGWGSQT